MNTANDAIAQSITNAEKLISRFAEDLSAQEYLHRPAPAANCVAWLLGHLTLSNRSAMKRLGVTNLPPLPDNFEQRFGRGDAAPAASDFGDTTQLLPLSRASFEQLAAAVRSADAALLHLPLDQPHPMFDTIGGAMNFMAIHAAMHAGQMSIIRRSLGRPPVI